MPDSEFKPKFYPLKPENAEGFKKAVAWFGGRELIASLKGIFMYAIYGENMDPRSWMKPNIYPNVEEKVKFQREDEFEKQIKKESKKSGDEYEKLNSEVDVQVTEEISKDEAVQDEITDELKEEWAEKIFDYWNWKQNNFKFWEDYFKNAEFKQTLIPDNKKITEFWFDYIADSGDGQMGVYNVACMCFSDLWLEKKEINHKEKIYPEVKFYPEKAENSEKAGNELSENFDLEKYELLPRGYFLFMGGDTAYHSANYATLFERFQTPFRWGFTSVREFLLKKYNHKLSVKGAFFFLNGKRKNIFGKKSGKPLKKWDGTIALENEWQDPTTNKTETKLYWDSEPPRPFFGIPANHDYYDSIDGFNRLFRRTPFEDFKENMSDDSDQRRIFLQIPTLSREQEASYIAIRLPFDWWMFGIDSELEKLDFRQEVFFKQIMEKRPSKLILATPEPTTVFGKKGRNGEKTSTYLASITKSLGLEQPFTSDGNFFKEDGQLYCRLDLSGDVHHYARYWGEDTRGLEDERFTSNNYASLVAGGGGAFFDSTSTLIGETTKDGVPLKNKDGTTPLIDENDVPVRGEIPPQAVYPSAKESINRTADRLFDLWNIKKGGYIQYAGAISAALIFLLLTQFSNLSKGFDEFNRRLETNGWNNLFSFPKDLKDFILNNNYSHIVAGLVLIIVIGSLSLCAYRLTNLIKKLKEKNFKDDIDERIDGRIIQLLANATPLFFAVGVYLIFVRMLISPENYKNFILNYGYRWVFIGLIMFAVAACAGIFAYRRRMLVKAIERQNSKAKSANQTGKQEISPTVQILKTSTPAFIVIAVCIFFLLVVLLPTFQLYLGAEKIPNFTNSSLLLFHIVIAILLIWLSFDYTNWLAIRFKVSRKFTEKTVTQIIEDPNEQTDNPFLKFIGKFFREYSVKYFPANILVGLAIIVLIFGTVTFGRAELSGILADLILTLVVVGNFAVLTFLLAYSVGAAYQNREGKRNFLIIGLCHAILQILTPFVLYFYTHWIIVLFIFGLVLVVNGFSKVAFRINKLFPDAAQTGLRGWLQRRVNYRWGAEVMKLDNRVLLSILGITYGLVVLLLPFAVRLAFPYLPGFVKRFFPELPSFNQTVLAKSQTIAKVLTDANPEALAYWIYLALSILIVGFIGYRMSRVWFSWYMAVSVLFDGHNNEAGGLARIEDFKHILRIKVEEKKLTVYVIGLDNAHRDLDEKLKLKLVDKFELNCLPIS